MPPSPKISSNPPSEVTSDRDDTGCMAHIVYMALEHRKMPLSQVTCDSLGECDSTLLREDWLASLLPHQYTSATLRATHSAMYRSLRGSMMCYREECANWDPWARAGILTALHISRRRLLPLHRPLGRNSRPERRLRPNRKLAPVCARPLTPSCRPRLKNCVNRDW